MESRRDGVCRRAGSQAATAPELQEAGRPCRRESLVRTGDIFLPAVPKAAVFFCRSAPEADDNRARIDYQ
jgi:hypothetical protein